MIKSAARFLPGVIASVMLWSAPGSAKAAGTAPSWEESGQASWYGGWHQGRRTSSGALFDQNAMTAAHSNLPLGTKVRVTMQDTGESVVVTITDRQPPKGLRVIDLSRGAASRIGLLSRGTGMVDLAAVTHEEAVEVAEAPESIYGDDEPAVSPRRRGRLHTRHGRPTAGAARPCCHAPSVVQARHSVQRQAARRRL